jgi:hypothetical protein
MLPRLVTVATIRSNEVSSLLYQAEARWLKSFAKEPAMSSKQKLSKKSNPRMSDPKANREDSDLGKTLSLIKAHPGIRPSEINRLLNREESDGLRATLIKRGLIRKEKDGSAMRYYPT